ncbi:MAG: serine hydrolase domain-containing protein [Anaerolineae bacterium]
MIRVGALDRVLREAVPAVAPAVQLVVRQDGEEVFARACGWLDPERRLQPVTPTTRFDLASLTKLFAVTAFMTLVEEGRVTLEQPVSAVLPAFAGERPIRPYEDPLNPGDWVTVVESEATVDAARVTFRQLLTHTSGLPAWRPLYLQPDAGTARQMALTTFFSYPPGTRVVYSDVGLILLGFAVERLTGRSLETVVEARVLTPLGLRHTTYRPSMGMRERCAPTEFCRWRERRICGEVHDENAYRLGGISAHAGLFSTAWDVADFGQSFLTGGLLSPVTVAAMTRCQAEDEGVRRGLGFALRVDDPRSSGYPFGEQAFGHTGFTGTSLWIDPARELVVALLTNEVYYGREHRRIAALRSAVHRAVSDTR